MEGRICSVCQWSCRRCCSVCPVCWRRCMAWSIIDLSVCSIVLSTTVWKCPSLRPITQPAFEDFIQYVVARKRNPKNNQLKEDKLTNFSISKCFYFLCLNLGKNQIICSEPMTCALMRLLVHILRSWSVAASDLDWSCPCGPTLVCC